jgi:hypothetical protein
LTGVVERLADANTLQQEQNYLQKEFNDLQKKMMRNEVRPDITNAGASTQGTENTITVKLINNGHQAIVTEMDFKEDFVTFARKILPMRFPKGSTLKIDGVSNGKQHITTAPWSITIYYKDVYQNKYAVTATGTSTQFNLGFVEIDSFEISDDKEKHLSKSLQDKAKHL